MRWHNGVRKLSKKVKAPSKRLRFEPTLELLEGRCLPSVGAFLQGYAYQDGKGGNPVDGHFESGEGLPNAVITLFASDKATILGTATTSASGYYRFDDSNVTGGNLSPATYYLVETAAPVGYVSSGVDAISQVSPASPTTVGGQPALQVTIVDPAHLSDTFHAFGAGHSDNPTYQGQPSPGFTGELIISLSGPNSFATPNFFSYCVDLNNGVGLGQTFSVLPTPSLTGLPNGGEIAYLYNHYGLDNPAALGLGTANAQYVVENPSNSAATKNDLGEALQEAIWKLEYGNQFSPDPNSNANVQNAYSFYLADANGKQEAAVYLDATLGGTTHPDPNGQGMLATETLDFQNVPQQTNFSPTIITTANPAAVTLPTGPPGNVTLSDSAVLSGGSSPTGTIAFTLSGPGGFSYTQTDTVSGNGTYTASTTLPTSGKVAGT
jgi:hypothetical protein